VRTRGGATNPQQLAVGEGLVCVAEYNNGVQVFQESGKFVRMIQATKPVGVAVAPSGEIVVSEMCSRKIRVFRADGTPVREWLPENGSEGKYLSGVAVNRLGEVLVADTGNDRVLVFRLDGSLVREFKRPSGPSNPAGIAVSAEGEIFVTDTFCSAVLVFR